MDVIGTKDRNSTATEILALYLFPQFLCESFISAMFRIHRECRKNLYMNYMSVSLLSGYLTFSHINVFRKIMYVSKYASYQLKKVQLYTF